MPFYNKDNFLKVCMRTGTRDARMRVRVRTRVYARTRGIMSVVCIVNQNKGHNKKMVRSGRGWSARKATWLKKHDSPWNKGLNFSSTSKSAKSPTLKRLTHQDFDSSFKLSGTGKFLPRAEGILSASAVHSPGATLRPLVEEPSEVENILQEKELGKVSGYAEVHVLFV